ncbi:MAG TPA: glycosyltransferase family 1 protein [Microbacteriaceae bacterium]|nr:glycosyltransferase family 1 protein [Microbacteriaceae bacterium]
MRIAFVTETWQPSVNGVVTRLAAHIDWLTAAGHQVLVIAPRIDGSGAGPQARPGVTVLRIPSFRTWVYGGQPWGWPLLGRVRRMLAAFHPDVVHVVGPFVLGIAGVIAARRLRLPLVASFHTDIAAYAGSYRLGWSRPIIWRILRALHNAAAVNLVTSEHSATLLREHGIRGVRLWRRGVDVARFAAAAARHTAARPPGEPVAGPADEGSLPTALYVGRIADEKHLTALLPLARSGRVRLMLVGDGPDRGRLERLFAGTGTVFTGTLTGPALVEAYAAADAFVFPSVTETLGLVLIEALASGLPIVAVRSPASEELVGRLRTARLVEAARPQDFWPALAELLAVHEPAEEARYAQAQAAGWGWPAAAEQVFACYAGLVARPAPASAVAVPEAQGAGSRQPSSVGRPMQAEQGRSDSVGPAS